MSIHFGTDGIRGTVGEKITADYVLNIAHATAIACQPKRVVIGWDTRKSGDYIVSVFAGVLASHGIDVIKVGIIPTTGLSFLTSKLSADLGVMITASHNDFTCNGIKIFSAAGEKIDNQTTAKIDRIISKRKNFAPIPADKVGVITENPDAIKYWQRFLVARFKALRSVSKGVRIAVDCAYGSGGQCAGNVLNSLGFDVTLFNTEYNGININHECGATKPRHLRGIMQNGDFDIGFSFDGDADRCVVVDKNGETIHGDVLIYLLAKYLNAGKIAVTVLFNLGVKQELNKIGIKVIQTDVGDKYIYKAIKQHRLALGGETSGHIIISNIWCSGDGLLTALMTLAVMQQSGKTLGELAKNIETYPQVSNNIPVTSTQKKKIKAYVKTWRSDVGRESYKIIVRPSGTESIIRVTVEGPSRTQCEQLISQITLEIHKKL